MFYRVLSAIALLTAAQVLSAATHTVSNYTQLRDKMATAKSGDVILINPGTYQPPNIIENLYSLSGSNGGINRRMAPRFAIINKSNITLKAANASNKPKLVGGGVLDDRYILYAQKANGLRVENIIFENARIAIVADRSDNIKIQNNILRNTGNEALHLRDGSDGALIKNNQIYNVGYERKDRGEAIYICNDKKKWHQDYDDGKNDDIYEFHCDNTIIEGNTIGPNIGAELIDIKEGVSGTIIRNNTFIAAITDNKLITASGDFTKSLIHDKGYNTLIHNNTFDFKSGIWYDSASEYGAIRVEQVLDAGECGADVFGHKGRYVNNTVKNSVKGEFVVVAPGKGGSNVKAGCDANGSHYRYFKKSKRSAFGVTDQDAATSGYQGNIGTSIVSGSSCSSQISGHSRQTPGKILQTSTGFRCQAGSAGGGSTSTSSTSSSSSSSSSSSGTGGTTCLSYSGTSLKEFTLNSKRCITVSGGLSGKEISIADSDTNASCDIRGTVTGSGGGSRVIDGNWELISGGFSGNTLNFNVTNNCFHVKIRVR